MAQRAIARKSQLLFDSVIPVTVNFDELVAAKFKKGKFIFTVTGSLKLLGIALLLPALSIFLITSKCEDSPQWRYHLFPISSGILVFVTFLMYLIFASGLAMKIPGFYVKIDIIALIVCSLVEIGSAVATMSSCSGHETLKKVPECLGIAGALVLALSCASLVLMYRYREDEEEHTIPRNQVQNDTTDENYKDPRKSVAA